MDAAAKKRLIKKIHASIYSLTKEANRNAVYELVLILNFTWLKKIKWVNNGCAAQQIHIIKFRAR